MFDMMDVDILTKEAQSLDFPVRIWPLPYTRILQHGLCPVWGAFRTKQTERGRSSQVVTKPFHVSGRTFTGNFGQTAKRFPLVTPTTYVDDSVQQAMGAVLDVAQALPPVVVHFASSA